MGAVAKWLKRRTADAEIPGSSPNHGMEELSRSSFNHCFTPSRCNGYLALENLSNGAGLSSDGEDGKLGSSIGSLHHKDKGFKLACQVGVDC